MDIKDLLKNIRAERIELECIRERADELRNKLLPKAITYDGINVQSSPGDRTPEVMAQLIEVEEMEGQRLVRLATHIRIAEQVIDQMQTPEHRNLLSLRYIHGKTVMSWYDVAEEMGYSSKYVRGKLHGRALSEARHVWEKWENEEEARGDI